VPAPALSEATSITSTTFSQQNEGTEQLGLDLGVFPCNTRREQKVKPTSQALAEFTGLSGKFSTILIDPPWRFTNRTGKVAPEHRRLHRYETMSFEEIGNLPVANHANDKAHLYMWCPNALLFEGLTIMKAWGFRYKTNVVWYKIRKDGGPDGRGVGFYFRNVTELLLFGVRGSMRTLPPGRRQVNIIRTRKEEHSRKPIESYHLIEQCSPGPFLELFARERVQGWHQWGDQVDSYEQLKPNHRGYQWRARAAAAAAAASGTSF
jgi:N6-adenosine-specific RNA methylase IME4